MIIKEDVLKVTKGRLAKQPIGYIKLKDPNIVELIFEKAKDFKDEPTMGGGWCYFIKEHKIDTLTFLELLDLSFNGNQDQYVVKF